MKIKPDIIKYWPYIPDHSYRILIIRGSGSGKINLLLNLIENQPNIGKIWIRRSCKMWLINIIGQITVVRQ